MPRSRHWARRTLFALAVCSVVPLIAGCPKKETPTVDAAPPPPPPEEDVQTNLVPMEEEDAGDPDTGVDAPVKKAGTAVNTNVARLKQCCNALSAEAKRMGNAPEAGMFTSAAATCTQLASQIGPSGNAPELGTIRGLLAGRNIPAVCAGF